MPVPRTIHVRDEPMKSPEREVPLDIFSALPVLIASRDGTVRFCNSAAEKLFGCDASEARSQSCWEVAGLKRRDGSPFCQENCPIRRVAGSRRIKPQRELFVRRPDGRRQRVELLTFPVPRYRDASDAILHLVVPKTSAAPRTRVRVRPEDLEQLTPREREVLRLLAGGLGTAGIAKRLGISPVTVRNHVQHTLEKLHVHGRLEAILSYLRDAR